MMLQYEEEKQLSVFFSLTKAWSKSRFWRFLESIARSGSRTIFYLKSEIFETEH